MATLTRERLETLARSMSFTEIADIFVMAPREVVAMANQFGIEAAHKSFLQKIRPTPPKNSLWRQRSAEAAERARTERVESLSVVEGNREERKRLAGVAFVDVLPTTIDWEDRQRFFRRPAPRPYREVSMGSAAALCVEAEISCGGRVDGRRVRVGR